MGTIKVVVQFAEILLKKGTDEKGHKLYTGFLSAEDLEKIAYVPNFRNEDSNTTIAKRLRDLDEHQEKEAAWKTKGGIGETWQRPLDTDRSQKMAEQFNKEEDFMCNPVLVGASHYAYAKNSTCNFEVQNIAESNNIEELKDTFILKFTYHPNSTEDADNSYDRPLWILDGQHRIRSLAQSKMKNRKIPVVFVIDKEENNPYTPTFMAKIFTQVTTEAKRLDALHQYWMSYIFDMKPFTDANYKNAMATSVFLCTEPTIDNKPNELFNVLKFHAKSHDAELVYKCENGHERERIFFNGKHKLTHLNEILALYFKAKILDQMTPDELGKCIIRFLRATWQLDNACKDPNLKDHTFKTCSEGSRLTSKYKGFPALFKAYFSKFIEYLIEWPNAEEENSAKDYSEDDWIQFLKYRRFEQNDWALEFIQGNAGTSGDAAKYSNDAAAKCFRLMFHDPKAELVVDLLQIPDVMTFEYIIKNDSTPIPITIPLLGNKTPSKTLPSNTTHLRFHRRTSETRSTVDRIIVEGIGTNVTLADGSLPFDTNRKTRMSLFGTNDESVKIRVQHYVYGTNNMSYTTIPLRFKS